MPIDENLSEEETDSAEEISDFSNLEPSSENQCNRDFINIHESEIRNNNTTEQIIEDRQRNDAEINTNEKIIREEQESGYEVDAEEYIKAKVKEYSNKSAQTEKYSFMYFLKTDTDLCAFTGIPLSILKSLVKCANLVYLKSNDKHICSLTERIVLLLCKLKFNLSFDCLDVLFMISKSTTANYFFETIPLLVSVLEEAVYFPDQEGIQQNIPYHFKNYRDTRIVLDCTEVAVENTKCLKCRLKMYSHYKGRQTLKVLIGITPSGLILFCSKYYGGRASDKTILFQSGLLDKLTPTVDAVMVDKGFLIMSECEERKIKVHRPPFANKREQMVLEDTQKTRDIAAARVHIERAIQRLKTYSILKFTISWQMTKYMDQIFIIICGLANLSAPILNKNRYSS